MPTSKGITKSAAGGPWVVKAPRMRVPLAKAIEEIAINGRTQRAAADIAGMTEKGLSKALTKPEVAAWLEHYKAQACLDAEKLKTHARGVAIREGIRLMTESGSDQVRAKLVEFFAGESRQPLVNVSINGPAVQAYSFTKPALPDGVSEGDNGQAIDITPQSDDC